VGAEQLAPKLGGVPDVVVPGGRAGLAILVSAAGDWLAFDGAGRSIGVAPDGSPLVGQVTMRLWKCAVLVIAGALAIGGVALYLTYSRDLQAINARLVAGSQVVETSQAHQGNGTMKIERTRWISQAIREFLASERKPAANEQ
jgi:hypothetical protein